MKMEMEWRLLGFNYLPFFENLKFWDFVLLLQLYFPFHKSSNFLGKRLENCLLYCRMYVCIFVFVFHSPL